MTQQATNAEKIIAWTAKSGHEIEVAVRMTQTDDGPSLHYEFRVNGGEWTRAHLQIGFPNRPYGVIGNVGMDEDRVAEILDAYNELKSREDWVESGWDRYYREAAQTEYAMTLGGRTY